jgi:hypothetical protein
MVFNRIRRAAAWLGLCGALAFVMPVGVASAKTHGQPTALTVTPQLATTTGTSQSSERASSHGVIEVAQNRQANRRRLRKRRAARRRQANRRRAANRRQANRRRAANRRQANRRRANRQRRVRRNGRWYTYRNGRWYDDSGAAVAAGVIGLAAGAIAGSALSNNRTVVVEEPRRGRYPEPYTAEWYRQCDLKYNSFRASDGTYLGYDGKRHTCRLP